MAAHAVIRVPLPRSMDLANDASPLLDGQVKP